MKKLLPCVKSLFICLILVMTTNSISYALESPLSDDDQDCGEWSIEGGDSIKDQRIKITEKPITANNCPGLYTLRNQTDINIGDISLGGGYTLQLDAISNDAQTQFLLIEDPFIPFLFPGLDIEIKAIPNDKAGKATVNLQGNLSRSAFTFDLAFFTVKSVLAFANIPCGIPTEQIFLASNRAAPILNSTAQLAFNGDLVGSFREFSKVFSVFNEKLYDIFKDVIVDCKVDALKPKNMAPAQAKILYAYLTWMPVVIFDYLQYEGAPASFTFVYTPPAPTISSEKWIAFINKDNIWLIHPDGSGLTPVTTNSNENLRVQDFKWSPDGKTLAYSMSSSSETAIILYDLQTSTSTSLITGVGGGFDWSLTGKQIIYDTPFKPPDIWSNKGLWVINLESGNKRQVVPLSSMDPQLSSEGRHVIFGIPSYDPAGYGVADVTTGEFIDLPLNPNGGIGAGNCEWAPSESKIACITVTDESPYRPELRLLDANGNVLQKLLLPEKMSGSSLVYWSPDGEKLAISYPDKDSFEIWWLDILSLDTNDIQPLARGLVADWSPDGQWILTWDAGTPHTISIVNIVSGQSFPISEGTFAVWQP